jgi:hypothetical protein
MGAGALLASRVTGGPFRLLDDAAREVGGSSGPGEIVLRVGGVLPRLRRCASPRGACMREAFISYEAGMRWSRSFAMLSPLGRAIRRSLVRAVADARKYRPRSRFPILPPPGCAPGRCRAPARRRCRRVKRHIRPATSIRRTSPSPRRSRREPDAVYASLPAARGAPWAPCFTGEHWLLSSSPELFFSMERGAQHAAD